MPGLLMGLFAVGCGDEQVVSQASHTRASAPLPTRRMADIVPPAPVASPDPLDAADPLTPGAEEKPVDPIDADSEGGDGLAAPDDPLASATGPKMPTDHSHWLRGQIFDARVLVRLNGTYLGEYSAPIDQDITMKLHAGVNTITFEPHPVTPTATARLDLLESEHDPPIPPLATFRLSPGTKTSPVPPETFTFVAH